MSKNYIDSIELCDGNIANIISLDCSDNDCSEGKNFDYDSTYDYYVIYFEINDKLYNLWEDSYTLKGIPILELCEVKDLQNFLRCNKAEGFAKDRYKKKIISTYEKFVKNEARLSYKEAGLDIFVDGVRRA